MAESTGADLSSVTTRVLEFEVKTPGDHIIKFSGVNTGWQGFLLPLCRVKLIPDPTGIKDINESNVSGIRPDGKYIEGNRIVIIKYGKKYSPTGAVLGD